MCVLTLSFLLSLFASLLFFLVLCLLPAQTVRSHGGRSVFRGDTLYHAEIKVHSGSVFCVAGQIYTKGEVPMERRVNISLVNHSQVSRHDL